MISFMKINKHHLINICILFFGIILQYQLTMTTTFAEERIDEQEKIATVLKESKMFKGTDVGFELDRQPTRAEGAVLLVRMLGKENEVMKGTYKHPFKDVPEWASNYVGYLYQNKLAQGVSATAYGSNQILSSNQYFTFALRSLGYSSGTDFVWNNAVVAAYNYGVIDLIQKAEFIDGTITRGGCADVTYSTLLTKYKGSSQNLIEKLVSNKSATKEQLDTIIDANDEMNSKRDMTSVLLESQGKILPASAAYTYDDIFVYSKSLLGYNEGVVIYNATTQQKTEVSGFMSELVYADDKYIYITVDTYLPGSYMLVLDRASLATVTKLEIDAFKFLTFNGCFCYIDYYLNLHRITGLDLTSDEIILTNVIDITVYQNRLYAISNDTLYGLNQTSAFKIMENIEAFEVIGDSMFYTTKRTNNNNQLIKMNLLTGSKETLGHDVESFSIVDSIVYYVKLSNQSMNTMDEVYPPLHSIDLNGKNDKIVLNEPVMDISGDGRFLAIYNTVKFNNNSFQRLTLSIYDVVTGSVYLASKDEFYPSATTTTINIENTLDEQPLESLQEISSAFFEYKMWGSNATTITLDQQQLIAQIPEAMYVDYVIVPKDSQIFMYHNDEYYRYAVQSKTLSSIQNMLNTSEYQNIFMHNTRSDSTDNDVTMYLVVLDTNKTPIAYYHVDESDVGEKPQYWQEYTIALRDTLTIDTVLSSMTMIQNQLHYNLVFDNITCGPFSVGNLSGPSSLELESDNPPKYITINLFVGESGKAEFLYDAEMTGIISIE